MPDDQNLPRANVPESDTTNGQLDTLVGPSRWSDPDHDTPTIPASRKMRTSPHFEVSKRWHEAMAIVSVNAGLWPREILTQYYRQQPLQKTKHPSHTEVDMTGSKRANERNIKTVTICYEDGDPGKITVMIIFVDEIDPNTQRPVVRLVTNTSINHVLEKSPGANCPLWLHVHSSIKHSTSPFQIIPCCNGWLEDLDFSLPMSNEEKQLPAVVDRLFKEVQNLELRLVEKEKELQERTEEVAQLRGSEHGGNTVVVPVIEGDPPKHAFASMLAEMQQPQHWPYVAAILLLVGIIVLK